MITTTLLRGFALGLPLFVLAACDTPEGTALARDQAKTVVDGVVADKFPGVDATPVTNCIIDNASGSELVDIATASLTGVTDATINQVTQIATRPDTINCYVEQAGPLLVTQIMAAA